MQNVIFIICILIILQKLVLHFFEAQLVLKRVHTTAARGRQNPWGATSGTVTGSLWVPFTLASPLLEAGIAIEKLFFSPPSVAYFCQVIHTTDV